jgi:drug/metabolite transporter (DMT)-like permease
MGILLGLATALAWGSADLCARFATRRIGTLRTMLYMQIVGLALLTAVLHWLGGFGHLADGSGWRPWAWGVLAGVLNAGATLALYRSFEIGKMSIVAPISAGYPALTTVLMVLSGEHLSMIRVASIVIIIAGVVAVARGEEVQSDADAGSQSSAGPKKQAGVGWAVTCGVTFGFFYWLLGKRIVPMLGSAPTVWIIRLTSVVVAAVAMLLTKQSIALPDRGTRKWILGVATLDTSAYVFGNYGMLQEQVSVVSVLASLYGAVTVGLAATILKEKISRLQWMGIVAVFVGIVLISR